MGECETCGWRIDWFLLGAIVGSSLSCGLLPPSCSLGTVALPFFLLFVVAGTLSCSLLVGALPRCGAPRAGGRSDAHRGCSVTRLCIASIGI